MGERFLVSTSSVLLVAIGLAMDAFAVSIAYGLSFRRREHTSALKIALAFGGFQAGMPVVGWAVGLGLRQWIEAVDHWVALGLLALIGGKMIRDGVKPASDEGVRPLSLAPLTLLALAVATSIDALAVGLALSVLGIAILMPVVIIGVVTFGISYGGIVLGYEFTSWLRDRGRRAVQVVGGLILIGIGLQIVYTHVMESGATVMAGSAATASSGLSSREVGGVR